MNTEQQRIAIAEACGWEVLEPEVKPAITYLWGLRECFIHEENKEIIPDYLNDLNAMHKAEKMLTPEQLVDYCAFSLRVATGEGCVTDYKMIRATASQRAEAFLRTIGKWEEAK